MDCSSPVNFEFNETLDGAVCNSDWHQAEESSLVESYRTSDFHTDELLQIMRAGETFVVPDRAADPRVDPATLAPLHIDSYVVVPIARKAQLRFALSLYDARPRDWCAEEVTLLANSPRTKKGRTIGHEPASRSER